MRRSHEQLEHAGRRPELWWTTEALVEHEPARVSHEPAHDEQGDFLSIYLPIYPSNIYIYIISIFESAHYEQGEYFLSLYLPIYLSI